MFGIGKRKHKTPEHASDDKPGLLGSLRSKLLLQNRLQYLQYRSHNQLMKSL